MKPDFLISTDEEFWPELSLDERIRCALTLAQRASERFYGLSFEVAPQHTLSLQERHSEPLSARVNDFLMEEADRLWEGAREEREIG